ELVKSSPTSVASVAITTEEQQGMPKEVKKLLEQEQVLEGELEVFYEDYEDHSKSRLHHVLKTADGRVELHISSRADVSQLHSGLRVSAKGWSLNENDNALFLDEGKNSIIISAQDSTSTSVASTETTTALISGTFGEQKTLVLLLNFQDNVQEPWTIQEAEELVFGKVNDFYRENSNDQTWLSGEVSGYITLAINEVCNINTIDNYAKQAATTNGIDTNSYDRLVYIFPKISNCGWTGMGTIGASQSRAWINGAFTVNTIGHELGHNFGLRHAQSLDCGVDIVGPNCTNFVYGDNIDIMGNGNGHFNGFNKESLGWVSSTEITTVISDGSYLVEPYETSHSGLAKVVKVPRGTDSETGKQLWYYIEYRQALGFDSFLEGNEGITDGVVIRLATESDMKSSQMLDMTPGSIYDDFSDAALSVGSSYTDNVAGVTITTEWADSTGASVHVSFAQPTCTQSEPAISVTSNQSTAMAPGSLQSYTVSVTNNDSDSCSSSNFSIEAEAPAGWTTTATTVDLPPGASDTITLDVTSDELATDGTYTITFNAFNSVDSSYYSSTTSSYLVETPVEVCEMGTPLLTVAANQSDEVEPGSTISYTATVTSQDSANCDSAVYNVALSVPNGWNGDSGTVTLSPGESQLVTLDAVTNSDASDGSYNVTVSVQHTTDSSLSVVEVESVLIATAVEPNSPPIALDDKVTLSTKEPVVIDVLANDSDPEGDILTVTSVTQGAKGTVQISGDGQVLYTPAKHFKGSDSFTYTISDGYVTSTATVSIDLSSTEGGGKGKGNRK
uniref:Ig-like domain-containing protein n=1 Tax=Marinomonas gallaica TaxID=1806667 RepID=UPI003A8CE380